MLCSRWRTTRAAPRPPRSPPPRAAAEAGPRAARQAERAEDRSTHELVARRGENPRRTDPQSWDPPRSPGPYPRSRPSRSGGGARTRTTRRRCQETRAGCRSRRLTRSTPDCQREEAHAGEGPRRDQAEDSKKSSHRREGPRQGERAHGPGRVPREEGDEGLRDRKHENGLHMDPDRSRGRSHVPPNEWFMDSFGRLSKTGDRYVRSIHKAEDDKIAEGCTFADALESHAGARQEHPVLQHTNFYDRGLEWRSARSARSPRAGRGGRGGARVHVPAAHRGNPPAFIRRITAKKRAEKMASRSTLTGRSTSSTVSAARSRPPRRAQGVAAPTQRPKKWEETLGVGYDPNEQPGAVTGHGDAPGGRGRLGGAGAPSSRLAPRSAW